ncbi:juvenile hormone esterase-like [Spodoptera litura]|uniref:Carboxylic ester hydrolase n=1 Tax=Spodoptera litura TaxID=69820 RepID=A0A9J7DPS9_SPOLT|nr:juvenile hormone esterase-like [Spodoptera litura]XP_022815874.1 juvenile hormone esterase-like [Spodoptera litura]
MKWLVLLSLIAARMVQQPTQPVRTRSGLVRGTVSRNGKFFQYFGIPYATVDDSNRFQAPLPPPTWTGIFDAVDENTWCPQYSAGIIIGKPNCLKLNVYTPTRITKPLPVMVFIHGGCFFSGTGSPFLYGGDFLAENDVVFVGINYRLAVEGFLCLGIKEAPGNAGLKDQITALKWIQQNIEAFGGNPNDVTIFGESAGAVSTSFLMLSPAARGLFHKAILQSGSSLVPWGLQHDPIGTASVLVKKLGYDTKDPKEIHKILSNKSAKEILDTISQFEDKYCVAEKHLFVPCIEKPIEGVEPVVTEYPTDILKSGNYTKVPMIIGYTDMEGIYFAAADYGTSIKNNSKPIEIFNSLQPDMEFPSEIEKNCTGEVIKRHYFSSYEADLITNMVELYSDVHFKFPLVLESELYTRTSHQPIYYYLFRYGGLRNMPKIISGFHNMVQGASHADELFYLFKPHAFPLLHSVEKHMITRMVTMWTNFAKYTDPTPHRSPLTPFRWQPSRRHNPTALIIDSKLSTAPLWEHSSVRLWNDTYNKYRRKNYGVKQYQQDNSVLSIDHFKS